MKRPQDYGDKPLIEQIIGTDDEILLQITLDNDFWNNHTGLKCVYKYREGPHVFFDIEFETFHPKVNYDVTSFQRNRLNQMRGRSQYETMRALDDEDEYRRRNAIKSLLDYKEKLYKFKSDLHHSLEKRYKFYMPEVKTYVNIWAEDCYDIIKEKLKLYHYESGEEYKWKYNSRYLPMKPGDELNIL